MEEQKKVLDIVTYSFNSQLLEWIVHFKKHDQTPTPEIWASGTLKSNQERPKMLAAVCTWYNIIIVVTTPRRLHTLSLVFGFISRWLQGIRLIRDSGKFMALWALYGYKPPHNKEGFGPHFHWPLQSPKKHFLFAEIKVEWLAHRACYLHRSCVCSKQRTGRVGDDFLVVRLYNNRFKRTSGLLPHHLWSRQNQAYQPFLQQLYGKHRVVQLGSFQAWNQDGLSHLWLQHWVWASSDQAAYMLRN